MTTYWIPGWQFGADAYHPLLTHLGVQAPNVLTYADFSGSRRQWLQAQNAELAEDCTLVGWSLGGMLACELAAMSDKVQKVLVLNANTRFAGGPGLDPAVAENFLTRYQRNAELTRKRFAALVDAEHPAEVQDHMLSGDHLATLHWLYEIDLQSSNPGCPVSVLLADDDRLVPMANAKPAWQTLTSDIAGLPGQHSLPLSQPEVVAQWLRERGVSHG